MTTKDYGGAARWAEDLDPNRVPIGEVLTGGEAAAFGAALVQDAIGVDAADELRRRGRRRTGEPALGNSPVVRCRIPEGMHARLHAYMGSHALTQSEVLREALGFYLDHQDLRRA